ncbi:MAG TPA: ABC transporter substrate-binding protein, partial [Acetobacteraceae bacterium]|nr:ABC transporter substrate-binding protein [Acetobacteraceae bacterium]
ADIITELGPDQIKTVEAISGCHVVGGPIMNIRVLVYDSTNPVLADPRVRRALSLAIDRKLIVDTLYDGRTTVTRGLQHPSFGPLYLADYQPPGYDPDAARALLKAAGYDGAPILYRILNNYYALQVQTAQVLVEMWQAVGLKVNIEVKENFSQVLEAKGGRGIYDTSDTIFWQDPVGIVVRRYGPASGVQAQYKTWSNAEFNKLCDTLQTSLDTDERRRAVAAALKIYDETDPPGTTLHTLAMFYGKRRDLHWTPYEAEFMDFRAANMT